MDAILRARLERLEGLIDAAPSPDAWVELCAALSEWPDHERLEIGIDFVRARMHAWPRALRSAPEWWRMAWERCVPEPRLALAGALEGPLLPADGGGSCPVQYDLYHLDRVYYVRYRHGHLSVDLTRIGGRFSDRELFAADLHCIEETSIGVGGTWSNEETNVILTLVSAAIRRGDLSSLELPGSPAALRASEHFMLGPYPLLVTRLSESKWSDPFQACNQRWMEMARRAEPVPAAVAHHLALARPAALGPTPAPTRRVWFRWHPWSDPRPPPQIIERRCELRLLTRLTIHDDIGIHACAFLDDTHVAFSTDDHALYVLDLRTHAWGPPDAPEEAAAALARAEAPPRDDLPECVILDDDTRFVRLDDGRIAAFAPHNLCIWDPQTGVCQAELSEFFDGVALATRGAHVVFGDDVGELWIFEVGPPEVVEA